MEAIDDKDLLISQGLPLPVPALSAKGRKGHNTKALPEEKVVAVKKLAAEGKSCQQISKELNIGKSTASLLLRKEKSKPAVEPMDTAIVDTFANSISVAPALPSRQAINDDAKLDAFLEDFMSKKPSKASKGKAAGKKEKKDLSFLNDFAPPPPPVVAKPVHKEPEMDKTMLMTKININVENFPEVLADYIKPNKEEYLAKVSRMSLSELKNTLSMLETTRISTNMANQMKHLLFGAAAGIEFGTKNLLRMKTDGYADAIRRQEMEIQSCLREIALDNIETYKAVGLEKPQTRLATIMVMSLLSIDSRNRVAGLAAKQANTFVEPTTAEKFNDL